MPNGGVSAGGGSYAFGHDVCHLTGERAPRVAFCIAGALRSFTDPRVYKSIRHNLLDAFSAESVVFVYGKLNAGLKPPGFRDPVQYDDARASNRSLRRALTYLTENNGPQVHHTIVRSSAHAINEQCNFMTGNPTQDSNVGQMQSLSACYAMVEAHESRSGVAFDAIARVRPDGAWYASVRPHCWFNLRSTA